MKISELGLHFSICIRGLRPDTQEKEILKELKPLGVHIGKQNFVQGAPYEDWIAEFKGLLSEIRALTGHRKMLFSIDHEGGRVQRTPPPLTVLPYPVEYAEAAGEIGELVGRELTASGINLLFGPCCDIDSNPDNPVIGKRAFGTTPKRVSEVAVKFILGANKTGLICCAKHFPGHGDTNVDSHLELPTLNLTEEELFKRELIPFKTVIKEGVPMIMTSHILFPALDPVNPATLSKYLLSKILRGKLGFTGVIVTDDIDMKALSDNFATEELGASAFNAGVDLLLFNRRVLSGDEASPDQPIQIARGILKQLGTGKLDKSLLEDSKARLNRLLKIVPEPDIKCLPQSMLDKHQLIVQNISPDA